MRQRIADCFDLLQFCRDPDCDRYDLHAAHGPVARSITAVKQVIEAFCAECGLAVSSTAAPCAYCRSTTFATRVCPGGARGGVRHGDVNDGLVEITYGHVGEYVPTPFAMLHRAVIDDFGVVSDRSVQRALRVLIDARRVASLGDITQNPRTRAPGWYVRYDSPKLWRRGGLRDLVSVAMERAVDSRTEVTT